jgi:hypothetical protein
MARDDKLFFICFLAIWASSFEKALFRSFVHFYIGSLLFWELSFSSYLYILVINPLSDVLLAKIFCHSVYSLFNLVTSSFAVQNLLISWSAICPSFLLVAESLDFY